MKTIISNPEFASEVVCIIPYAYWLHQNGMLDKVITSKDMRPFYYFCDDVEEQFEQRTLDNKISGLNHVPNNWIHGINSLEEPGVLDYSEWSPPPYVEKYKTDLIDSPYVVINII